jgi:maltoporin
MRRAVPLALALLWAAPAAADSAADPAPAGGFDFGSYGRVAVASDLRGSTPEAVNVVAHGPRIVEPTYLELDFYYRLRAARGIDVTTVTTVAFGDRLFHDTGTFDARIALRNLYLLAERDVCAGRLGVWAGSRMLRGDDIYLLDYWPLDDINTVGAGVSYRIARMDAAVHAGLNRLLDPFQYQEREVGTPEDGTETVPELDRQRFITSTQFGYRLIRGDKPDQLSARVKLYLEAQALPSGTRRLEDDTVDRLPTDAGWSLGAQLALWGFAPGASHASLFARHSRGLTAYDELDAPMDVAPDRKSYPGASELVLGLGGNLEQPWGGVLLGATTRRFRDGDVSTSDVDDGWEYVLDARPRVHVIDALEAAVDVSWQVRFPRGLSPTTLTAADPAVFQVAPMVLYSPFGPGSYARPQFRLVYRAAHLNDAALDQLYPLEDPRRGLTWVHYLGVQAEWWFNSSTYRR